MRGFKVELLAGVAAIAIGFMLPVAGHAAAPDGAPPHGRMFEKFDTDHDGKLSPEERKAAGEARFGKIDANGDGFVSHDEALANAEKRGAERAERMFKVADTDGDGKISRAEFDAAGEKMRQRMASRRNAGAPDGGPGAPLPDASEGEPE